MSRLLIITGLVLILAGIALHYGHKLPLGKLPGDITIKREGFQLHMPLMTSLLLSVLLSVLLYLYYRWKNQ